MVKWTVHHRVFVETLINFWNKIETRKFEDQILNDDKFSNLKKKKQNVKYLSKKFEWNKSIFILTKNFKIIIYEEFKHDVVKDQLRK